MLALLCQITRLLQLRVQKSIILLKEVSAGINSIGSFSDGGTANVITLTEAHRFLNGESVRVIGETGQIPDGLESKHRLFCYHKWTYYKY